MKAGDRIATVSNFEMGSVCLMLATRYPLLATFDSGLLHFFPFLRAGGLQHGVGDVIGGEAILEVGCAALAAFKTLDELHHRVHEAVLVAELEAGHPPIPAIRMIAVGDVDALPSALLALV